MSFFGSVSAREHNGLRLVMWLATTHASQKPIALAAVAKRENLSVKYLEQLVAPFRDAKWVQSSRGRFGGYVLQRDPATITLRDVLGVLNGHPLLLGCLAHGGSCPHEQACMSKKGWQRVQLALEHTLAGITLAELL